MTAHGLARGASALLFSALAFVSLSARPAAADDGGAIPATPCDAWDIEYALSANLELTNTTMNQGDGVYPVGPGALILRFEDQSGQPGGRAKMLAYTMRQSIRVVSKALFWTTTVVTDSTSRAAPDSCGVIASGVLGGMTLTWATPVRNVRSDGTIKCEGGLCGKFGAPPPGESDLHIGPNAVTFQPFQFQDGLKTFSMPSTFVSKTDQPKQTARIALAGRETKRTCVAAKPCP